VISRCVIEYLQVTQSFEIFPPPAGEHLFDALAGIRVNNTLHATSWCRIRVSGFRYS